jgi:hypothetical protein
MTPLESVQQEIAQLQAKLDAARQPFRAPPPVPTACCGRGCNGCVWESYFAAADWWVEEAQVHSACASPEKSANRINAIRSSTTCLLVIAIQRAGQ